MKAVDPRSCSLCAVAEAGIFDEALARIVGATCHEVVGVAADDDPAELVMAFLSTDRGWFRVFIELKALFVAPESDPRESEELGEDDLTVSLMPDESPAEIVDASYEPGVLTLRFPRGSAVELREDEDRETLSVTRIRGAGV